MDRPVCAAIPAGSFLMGCEQGRDEEKPVHRVWVDAFEMAVHQVRNRDFARFVDNVIYLTTKRIQRRNRAALLVRQKQKAVIKA